MPIDPSVAIGADLGSRSFSWSSSDVLLYHLGIGAGARSGDNLDPSVLRWTTEHPGSLGGQQVLPSFGVVAPTFHETEAPSVEMPGVQINLSQVVHGSQSVTVHAPIPTSGSATQRTTLTDVWDKGKAAVIWQDATVTADDGTDLWTTRSSIFVRGEGGFGGDRGTSDPVVLPDRESDADVTYTITPQQALVYRLCGDRNPLHSDPGFAKAAGFPAPILHGLCSYGITLRELTTALLDGDATKVGGFAVKFAGVVFPGETIRVRGWREDGRIIGSATVAGDGERDGAAVLSDVVLTLA
jgi:acyl dehydratase